MCICHNIQRTSVSPHDKTLHLPPLTLTTTLDLSLRFKLATMLPRSCIPSFALSPSIPPLMMLHVARCNKRQVRQEGQHSHATSAKPRILHVAQGNHIPQHPERLNDWQVTAEPTYTRHTRALAQYLANTYLDHLASPDAPTTLVYQCMPSTTLGAAHPPISQINH
jgi:hypothetical protein